MTWYRSAKSSPSDTDFDHHVKHLVRINPFFANMFKSYGINGRDMMGLRFRLDDLKGKHAECRGDDEIVLDRSLLQSGIDNVMHYVAHELSHWLTRKKEKENYFADPEEIKGFEWAIAYEISRGQGMDEIVRIFLPLLKPHFDSEGQTHRALLKFISEAKKLIRKKS